MHFFKKYKVLFVFILFIAAGVFGYILAQSSPVVYNEETMQANMQTQRIGVDCEITYRHCYMLCGHQYESVEKVTSEYVDLSQTELRERLEATSIKKFSPNQVILEKQHHTYCENHVLLYLKANALYAMQCEPYTDNMQEIWRTTMHTDTFSTEEQQALEKGKVFTNLAEAQAYVAAIE